MKKRESPDELRERFKKEYISKYLYWENNQQICIEALQRIPEHPDDRDEQSEAEFQRLTERIRLIGVELQSIVDNASEHCKMTSGDFISAINQYTEQKSIKK